MLPFLYGLLFFLLQLTNVLITHHPQPFSDSKMNMNRFRIFKKSPTSRSLKYDYSIDSLLIRHFLTTLTHSRNMSAIISDQYLVYKILKQIPIKSLSSKWIKSLVCSQTPYNYMKSPANCTGISAQYEDYITSADAKKYHSWTHVPTNNHSLNISLTKFKKLENHNITTITTYWEPISLFSTTILLIGKELNKPPRIEMLNPQIQISLLIPDRILSKLVSFSETHPNDFTLCHGNLTSTLLKKNQYLSQEHKIGHPAYIPPKVSNNLLNLLENTRKSSLNHYMMLLFTEIKTIIKDPLNLAYSPSLMFWSRLSYYNIPFKLEHYHYLSMESPRSGIAALMDSRCRPISHLQATPSIKGCIFCVYSVCYNMLIRCCFGNIIKLTYVIYLLLLLHLLVRIKLTLASNTYTSCIVYPTQLKRANSITYNMCTLFEIFPYSTQQSSGTSHIARKPHIYSKAILTTFPNFTLLVIPLTITISLLGNSTSAQTILTNYYMLSCFITTYQLISLLLPLSAHSIADSWTTIILRYEASSP
jgi:hypothetical protein